MYASYFNKINLATSSQLILVRSGKGHYIFTAQIHERANPCILRILAIRPFFTIIVLIVEKYLFVGKPGLRFKIFPTLFRLPDKSVTVCQIIFN